jgi:hypothetical protein
MEGEIGMNGTGTNQKNKQENRNRLPFFEE